MMSVVRLVESGVYSLGFAEAPCRPVVILVGIGDACAYYLHVPGLDFPLTAWIIVRSKPLIRFEPVIADLYHALVERL